MFLVFTTATATLAKSKAESILDKTGVTDGIVVVLGCDDQELLTRLRASDRCLVHGLDTSNSVVERVRENLHSKGLYGPISVTTFDGANLPYADNLVNLIVAENLGEVTKNEIMRVLAPYGVAVIAGERIIKPWPKEIDEWTHNQHGPDNNPVAMDKLVAPPRHLQWISDPLWARSHEETPSTSAFVSAHGRVFYIMDETPRGFGSGPETWKVVARNAFNGMLLWKKDIPVGEWGNSSWSKIKEGGYYGRFEHPVLEERLVAVDDTVYVTLGYNAPVTALDAETGKELYKYTDSSYVDEIAVDKSTLYVSSYSQKQAPLGKSDNPASLKKVVKAYNTKTHKCVWTSKEYSGLNPKADHLANLRYLFMTIGAQHVFVVDGNEVVALSRTSGKEAWRAAMPADATAAIHYGYNSRGLCTLLVSGDILLVDQMLSNSFKGKNEKLTMQWSRPTSCALRAYDVNTGNIIWTIEAGTWGHYSLPESYVIDGVVWVYDKEEMAIHSFDLKTGEEKMTWDTTDIFNNGHHHRCYQNRATEKYLIISFRGLEYLAWDSDETDHNHWVRSSCQLGMFPCNGLSFTLPHPCDCYITSKLNGVLALAGRQANDKRPISEKLKTGTAYERTQTPNSVTDPSCSWPTYRHDPERSSYIPIEMPKAFETAWRTDLRAKELTPPVVSDNLVFVAGKDTHTLYALDSATGRPRWDYITDGPIDTPPTIYKGLAIVGSGSGWVYCLRANDGVLVWKFYAAPKEQLVCAFGKLESSWPVHGAVLVENDNAYVVAGRSSYLDGGFYKYRVDIFTGKILEEGSEKSDAGVKTDRGRDPAVDYGLLSDILVKNGESIFMRQRSIFGERYTGSVWGKGLAATAGFLDDSWFNRTGYYLDGIAFGSLVAFSENAVFSIRAYREMGPNGSFNPAQKGYQLTATARNNPQKPKADKKWIDAHSPYPTNNKWQKNIRIRMTSLVSTKNLLFGAGTRDIIDQGSDPWETYRGKKGGIFMCVYTETGETIFETELSSAPVYDGMAVVQGSVLLSLRDGSVVCLASAK